MNLCNGRNKIIKSFEDKNIIRSNYVLHAKFEPERYDGVEESEPKFDESIGERVKLRRQEANDEADNDDEQTDTTDMPDLESDESAEQRRSQSTKGLKILTPNHMLRRLPIWLAQLKAGNNSKKFKNEIRQLLYSLYR